MTKQSDKLPAPPPLASRGDYGNAFTGDEIDHRLDWERLVDSGAIPNRNPPMSAENRAILEANDRLFRERARRHRNGW